MYISSIVRKVIKECVKRHQHKGTKESDFRLENRYSGIHVSHFLLVSYSYSSYIKAFED